MVKLSKKLSLKTFILSQILILIFSLTFLAGLYYILNIQYGQNTLSYAKKGPVTTLPKSLRLELEQPADDTLVFTPSVIVSGKTGPKSLVLLATDTQNVVIESNSKGAFSTVLKMDEGINNLRAVVFDATGDSRSDERTVYYSKEKI